jgi:hypothetical protein
METGNPYERADYSCQLGEARRRVIAALLDK